MEISFDFLQSLDDGKRIAVYEIQKNDHIRFVAPYNGKFYVLFWLSVSADGSVCCGVRDLAAKKYATGTIQCQNGKNVLDWSKLPEMVEAEDLNRLKKMTFHSSGKIHSVKYGEVTLRKALHEITTQEELFLALFKEPSQYEEINGTAKKKDIPILAMIPEGHPVFLQAFIAPKEQYCDVTINRGVHQYNAVLECNGIAGIGDIVIQLCFSFSDKAEYPPYSYMIWPTLSHPAVT